MLARIPYLAVLCPAVNVTRGTEIIPSSPTPVAVVTGVEAPLSSSLLASPPPRLLALPTLIDPSLILIRIPKGQRGK
jgi:hypothetical protein